MDSGEFVDGAFAVEGICLDRCGKSADILPHHDDEVIDLGEVIVLPGLINAHCHLEYILLRGVILPSRNFPQWIERINALKRSLTDTIMSVVFSRDSRSCAAAG